VSEKQPAPTAQSSRQPSALRDIRVSSLNPVKEQDTPDKNE
jgi:hypothetical protein